MTDTNKELPFISCKCITYGRVDTLVEALYSFIIQDYPQDRCELIIVNDYPLQELVYDMQPNIRIFNLKETFPIIGDKENFAIEKCQGELIAVWDDDDIALSNHLSNIAEFWKEDSSLLHWGRGAFYNEPSITALQALGNSGIVYSKKAWELIGKSPIQNAGGDMTLTNAITALDPSKVVYAYPEEDKVSWFYRWFMPSANTYHQSGQGTDVEGRRNIVERHIEHIERLRVEGIVPIGTLVLEPVWKNDYKQLLINFLK
jgi:hypothetical protein